MKVTDDTETPAPKVTVAVGVKFVPAMVTSWNVAPWFRFGVAAVTVGGDPAASTCCNGSTNIVAAVMATIATARDLILPAMFRLPLDFPRRPL
jgi:hypothetical protein